MPKLVTMSTRNIKKYILRVTLIATVLISACAVNTNWSEHHAYRSLIGKTLETKVSLYVRDNVCWEIAGNKVLTSDTTDGGSSFCLEGALDYPVHPRTKLEIVEIFAKPIFLYGECMQVRAKIIRSEIFNSHSDVYLPVCAYREYLSWSTTRVLRPGDAINLRQDLVSVIER